MRKPCDRLAGDAGRGRGRGTLRALVAGLLLLGFAGAASPQARPLTIGLDGEHAFDAAFFGTAVLATGSDYVSMRAEIETVLGPGSIANLLDASFDTLDPQVLGAVMLKIPYAVNLHPAYTPAEMTAIQNYVAGGGSLFVLADAGAGSQFANLNQLVAPWGVSFREDPSSTIILFVDCNGADYVPAPHVITVGANPIGVDCHRPIVGPIAAPVLDLTDPAPDPDPLPNPAPVNVLALLESTTGSGRVFFLSDSTLWKDVTAGGNRSIASGGNRTLLINAIRYALFDSDLDTVYDAVDNCTDTVNLSQLDSDGDGCGNACDCDFDQDGACGASDFNTLRTCMGQPVPGTGPPADLTCAESDMDGSLVLGVGDFNDFRFEFGTPAGPSLVAGREGAPACP